MRKPKQSPSRERHIIDEIVVDAYGSQERALGWFYYLEDKLDFPFNTGNAWETRSDAPSSRLAAAADGE